MDNKNTKFITVAVLIGIVLTITIGIFASAYGNQQNVDRDKYYADHCPKVTQITDQYGNVTSSYTCGGK